MKTERKFRSFTEYVQDSIQNPKDAAAYLNAAAEDEDEKVFLIALKNVIEVHGGLSELSRKTSLNRGNLHRMLTGKGQPRFASIHKVLHASGFELAIRPRRRRTGASG